MLDGLHPTDVLYHIANAVILFVILRFLVYKPVHKFMNARTQRIAADLDEAEKARAEADELRAEYERHVAQAEQEARARALEITGAANESAKALTENARDESRAILEKAQADARAEHDKLVAGLQDEVVDLASDIAARILREHFESDIPVAGGERVE